MLKFVLQQVVWLTESVQFMRILVIYYRSFHRFSFTNLCAYKCSFSRQFLVTSCLRLLKWFFFSKNSKKTHRMKSYLKFVMVCTLIIFVHSMPQELGLDDSVEYIESSENETEIEDEIETSTMVTSTTTTTTTSIPSTTSTTSTASSIWRPTRTTTTARPFQPLRPNRPLASMVHSTLQTIESIVVSSGILATTLLESLMPTSARPIQGNNKANISNEIPTSSPQPEYSALDFRENEIPSKFE